MLAAWFGDLVDVHGTQMMNPNYFGDYQLVPTGQNLHWFNT